MRGLALLVALGAVAMAASDSRAGTKVDQDAVFTLTNGVIQGTGALGAVRKLANNTAYASCTIDAGPTATAPVITCWMRDKNGIEVGCTVIDMSGAASKALAAMNGDSLLTFQVALPEGTMYDAGAPTDGGDGGGVVLGSSTATGIDPLLSKYASKHWAAGRCGLLSIEDSSKYPPK